MTVSPGYRNKCHAHTDERRRHGRHAKHKGGDDGVSERGRSETTPMGEGDTTPRGTGATLPLQPSDTEGRLRPRHSAVPSRPVLCGDRKEVGVQLGSSIEGTEAPGCDGEEREANE